MSIEDRRFYKDVFRLVMPMAVQNLINVGVTSTDVIMLGRVGETALSGVSLANQVYFILSLLFFGLTSGACVLTAQYWGKKDTRTIEKVMGMSFRISIAAGIVFAVGAIFFPQYLMLIFTSDPAIIAEGVSYLKIVGFSYILSAFTNVYLNIIRSIERVVIATVVYGVSLCANIILNSIFIFGLLGCPAMGSAGAALGTLLSRAIEVIIVVYYAQKKNDVVKIHIRDFFVGSGNGSHLCHCRTSGKCCGSGPFSNPGVQTAVYGHWFRYLQCYSHYDRQGHWREERRSGQRVWAAFCETFHYLRHRRSCGDPGDLAFAASVPETDPAGKKLSVCHDGDHVLLCDRSVFKQHHCSRGAPGRGRYQVRTFSGCGSYVALLYCGSGSRSLCHRNPHAVGLYPAVQRRGDQNSFLPLEI